MPENWLQQYGIKERPIDLQKEGGICEFGIIPSKKELENRPPTFQFSHGFYVKEEVIRFDEYNLLLEIIEKNDLIQTLLSPYEIHVLSSGKFNSLSFYLHPYDKSVMFCLDKEPNWFIELSKITNNLLKQALFRFKENTKNKEIIFNRRVIWEYSTENSFEFNIPTNKVRGRFGFVITERENA